MKDRRYKKTEEKILTVFFDVPDCTMQQLAKRAGVGRSTLYTHHHSIRRIIPDYEKEILKKYNIEIEKKMKIKNVGIKTLYLDTLIFIIKNKQIFEMFLKFEDREIVVKMVLKLKPRIIVSEKALRICIAEIAEIIFEWGKRGFSENEIEEVLFDMMYLTLSARKRLGPIER